MNQSTTLQKQEETIKTLYEKRGRVAAFKRFCYEKLKFELQISRISNIKNKNAKTKNIETGYHYLKLYDIAEKLQLFMALPENEQNAYYQKTGAKPKPK